MMRVTHRQVVQQVSDIVRRTVSQKCKSMRFQDLSTSAARKGFGSFHSEDIEVLIRQKEEEYSRPEVYDEIISKLKEKNDVIIGDFEFGRQAKNSLFALDDEWTFINHGAFGATLSPLLKESNLLRLRCEAQPLRFYDRELLPMIAHSVRETAKFINCPPEELVPLQNVTSGLNSVINSIPLQPGDEIICLSITYGSTKKIMKNACVRSGAVLKIVEIPLPVTSPEYLIKILKDALTPQTKLVVLDQITSNTAMTLPIADLSIVSREAGAIVLIDAAHSLFSQDVSIYSADQEIHCTNYSSSAGESSNSYRSSDNNTSSSGSTKSNGNDSDIVITTSASSNRRRVSIASIADIWVTNAHKWMSGPKGCAFMWINPKMALSLRPAIISHGYVSNVNDVQSELSRNSDHYTAHSGNYSGHYIAYGKLLSSYSWDGCRDYSALLTAPSAISLWGQLSNRISNVTNDTSKRDLAVLRSYNTRILSDATDLCASEWGVSEDDFAAPKEMRESSPMSLVPLPSRLSGVSTRGATDKDAFALQEILHFDHKIEVPIKCLEGRLYTRISAHVYNTASEYEKLATVIKKMM